MSMPRSDAFTLENVDSAFATDVRDGLGRSGQKQLPSTWLYDSLGSALFEAITLLPEYGLTRADTRLICRHAGEIARSAGGIPVVAELGSGSGKKTRPLLEALGRPVYHPIDVSPSALSACAAQLSMHAEIRPIQASYLDGMEQVARHRETDSPMLVLFLGSTIGNFDRAHAAGFLADLRRRLLPGDFMLIGADLVKPADVMIAAYDDSAGVTAAFNRNILVRINRELDARFNPRDFVHEARWSAAESRIEMHLRSVRAHTVRIAAADLTVRFRDGETIWTESSHKYTQGSLHQLALEAGFASVHVWVDSEWPFAECLWQVV